MSHTLYFHIGCPYSKESILISLLNKGYPVYIIDEIGLRPEDPTLPYECVHGLEYDKLLGMLKQVALSRGLSLEQCHFFTLAEGSVDLLNRLLSDLGKPPVSRHKGSLKDKFWVRSRLATQKVEEIPFLCLAKNTAEIPSPSQSDYPLIVKPVGSMESRNVFRVNDSDELRRACLEVFTKNRTFIKVDHGEIVIEDVYQQNPFALIETCISGEKLSVEALVIDGKLEFVAPVSKFDANNAFFYERADIADPGHFDPDQLELLSSYIKSLIDALEVVTSILHVELFWLPKQSTFRLIEVNFRVGGGIIPELIEQAYGIDLVAEFLRATSRPGEPCNVAKVAKSDPSQCSIAYDFLTDSGGVFKPLQDRAFGEPIRWAFDPGETIGKFSTSKFYKVGTVLLRCPRSEKQKRLEHLTSQANEYFRIDKAQPVTEASNAIVSALDRSNRDASRFLKLGLIAVYALCCISGAAYLYRRFDRQAELLAQTMARTLAYHLANGEIYYVANIVNNFHSGEFYRRIVVIDHEDRIIHSASSGGHQPLMYQERISKSEFDSTLPIRVDGIDIGGLAVDFDYRHLLAQVLIGVALMSALIAGLYQLIGRHVFRRYSASAKKESDNLASVVNQLKQDLSDLHGRDTTFSTEKYQKLLAINSSQNSPLTPLSSSLLRLVEVLRDLRDGIAEKRRLADLLDESTAKLITATTQAEIAKVAAQVSHDIRSPLAALNVFERDLSELPEDKRLLVRSAIGRIRDIANNLLSQNRPRTMMDLSRTQATQELGSEGLRPQLIPPLLESLVSEKRLQYRSLSHIAISLRVSFECQAAFASAIPAELKRVLSNLIDNSIDAIGNNNGNVLISLEADKGSLNVEIADNGRGIPESVLPKLGQLGQTFGKPNGSGLGLFHAKTTLEKLGGTLAISSTEGIGTRINCTLPSVPPPRWFAPTIDCFERKTVVIVDDDESIHQTWRQRFSKPKTGHRPTLVHAQTPLQLKAFCQRVEENSSNSLYLIDFEFIGSQSTGLDIIQELGIASDSILVTSHADDPQLQLRCEQIGLRMLPKSIAGLVPISG